MLFASVVIFAVLGVACALQHCCFHGGNDALQMLQRIGIKPLPPCSIPALCGCVLEWIDHNDECYPYGIVGRGSGMTPFFPLGTQLVWICRNGMFAQEGLHCSKCSQISMLHSRSVIMFCWNCRMTQAVGNRSWAVGLHHVAWLWTGLSCLTTASKQEKEGGCRLELVLRQSAVLSKNMGFMFLF